MKNYCISFCVGFFKVATVEKSTALEKNQANNIPAVAQIFFDGGNFLKIRRKSYEVEDIQHNAVRETP